MLYVDFTFFGSHPLTHIFPQTVTDPPTAINTGDITLRVELDALKKERDELKQRLQSIESKERRPSILMH